MRYNLDSVGLFISFRASDISSFAYIVLIATADDLLFFTDSLLLARLIGQYCFVCWRLSSSVTLPAGEPAAGRVGGQPLLGRPRGQSGDRHRMAGQYGCVPLGRHFVIFVVAETYSYLL